jgi:predicted O-linked N-acetylglucosamine transferase (SPINDLY family)
MSELTIQQAFDLAVRCHQAGRVQEAEQLYRQILQQQPQHSDAIHLLGVIAHQMGQNDVALDLIRRAIALNPRLGEAHSNLGNVLQQTGRLDQSIDAYRQAILLQSAFSKQPHYAVTQNNLGNALRDKGQIDEAIAAYREAIALRPDYAEAHSNLGRILADGGRIDEAIAAYHQAIAISPNLAEAHSNLGNILRDTGQFDQALDACKRAIAIRPNFATAHNNLGNLLKDQGEVDEAVAAYRTAITLKPTFAEAHSNLVYALHFHPGYDSQSIAEEHRRWNRRHAEPLAKCTSSHANDRTPDRRLRIGYVSADFRDHVVGRNLLPLYLHHDHRQFEITCYAQVARPDAITREFQQNADCWRNIMGLTDEQLAGQVIEDRIDILVDLSGHTAGNRLLVFARKPAPVQASYLGYPGTTGLSAIDYRITDALADPPGLTDHLQSERLRRLPQTNWCFAAPPDSPPVGPLPASGRGYVTFGSFNNFAKVTEPMLQAWGRILHHTPRSRLLLKAAGLASASARDRVCRQFAAQGIDPDRLDLRGRERDQQGHLALYGEMDIALDTFPYHGTTTTLEALWMGVPVITLAGQTHVSRVGVSLLSNVGLPELIAKTTHEYERAAVELGNNPQRVAALRLGMRERMRASPLMNAREFAGNVEAAYREMWRIWCESGPHFRKV